MNSLPQISHHLFAAAVGSKGRSPARPAPETWASQPVRGVATAIPLELLSASDQAPPQALRPLRATVVGAGI
jgi:hypothetical protein